MLRGGQMGVKFRRQQPIDHYIVDFYCPDLRLVIEVDGGQHTVDVDAVRTAYLRAQGLQILRFWNNDILNNQPGVYLTIVETIRSLQAAKGTPSVSASPFRLCRATSPVKGEDKPI